VDGHRSIRRRARLLTALILLASMAVAAACSFGGGSDSTSTATPSAATPTATGTSTATTTPTPRADVAFTNARPIEVVAERVALCRCGVSANKPFCDNTHRETGFEAP